MVRLAKRVGGVRRGAAIKSLRTSAASKMNMMPACPGRSARISSANSMSGKVSTEADDECRSDGACAACSGWRGAGHGTGVARHAGQVARVV